MQCTKPYTVRLGINKGAKVPCGSCLHCRIQRSREWSCRLMHELDNWDEAQFVTLTYDNEHLPVDGSLKVEDLQKFFKRLRKALAMEKRNLKYFACGEYGEIGNRCHYHFIGFGIGAKDIDLVRSEWGKGHVKGGTVTYDSCRYVADYILKKVNGKLQEETYKGKTPPFRIGSQGLGKNFIEKERDRLINNLSFTARGQTMGIPRIYRKWLKLDKSCFVAGAIEAETKEERKKEILHSNRPKGWERQWIRSPDQQRDLNLQKKTSLRKRDFDVD